jgi:hypothetical protein
MSNQDSITDLEKHFPRLVEEIALEWGYPKFPDYIDHLLLDDRGDRQGFPETVVSELMFLRMVGEELLRHTDPPDANSVWDNPQYIKSSGHDGSD